MTRNQLIEWRRQKKRRRMLAAGGVTAALILALCIIIPRVKTAGGTGAAASDAESTAAAEAAADDEDAAAASDTAKKIAPGENMAGHAGWNTDSSGWWFMTDDGYMYASGWKTIDGQRYYFKDDGYMATGWYNTGTGLKDQYFGTDGIYQPSVEQKLVALTFDDGPSANTDSVLDQLEAYKDTATFFVVGQQAEYYTAQLQREYDDGMEIASHSYAHTTMVGLSASDLLEVLDKNVKTISEYVSATPKLMRPTDGLVDLTMVDTSDTPIILWDVDAGDGDGEAEAQTIVQHVENTVQDGSVVLMHDTYSDTPEALKTLLPDLRNKGYKVVTVSKLAAAYGYSLENGGIYYSFYPDKSSANYTKAAAEAALAGGGTLGGS
ncbi:MAG: polysaccharide deacetylase family protein [Chordicoccus sp.]